MDQSEELTSAHSSAAGVENRVHQHSPIPANALSLTERTQWVPWFWPHRGRIVFLFGKSDRPPPANDLDRASLFNSLMAYTGTVHRDGADRLVTTVDLALSPTFSGDQILFSPSMVTGSRFANLWQKLDFLVIG